MSGRIPQQFIDDLLARVDIVAIIDSRVPLKKAGREYKACCPFHQEKTPSFTVSQQKQFYHCFGCGVHGSAIGFLMDYDRMSFVEAIEELASQLGVDVPYEGGEKSAPVRNREQSQNLYELMEQVSRYYQKQLRSHPEKARAVDYLRQRGLSGETARAFELGYAPSGWNSLLAAFGDSEYLRLSLQTAGMLIEKERSNNSYDRFRDRIMFPIRDRRGRVIAFGGRVIDQGEPKYLNSPETPIFHKGRELYGLYQARQANRELGAVVVVEGYMDVVALAQHGVTNAVATLGTAITEHHIQELVRHTDEVIFCFDGDRAGKQAAWRALEASLEAVDGKTLFKFMFLPEGEDPDSLVRSSGKESFEKYLRNALPLSEFFYESLLLKADIRKLDGKARLLNLAKPYVLKLKDEGYRRLLVERLADGASLSGEEVMRQYGLATGARLAPRQSPATFTRGQQQVGSVARRAITLLIQHPALAEKVKRPQDIASLQVPGTLLLHELLEFLRDSPQINTAALLERWRGRDEFGQLAKLAAEELPLPPEGLGPEFLDTLKQLEQQGLEVQLDQLLKKSQYTELTSEEKRSLRELLATRVTVPQA
ncbi:MAG: DNA primase [Gammaproteobacteria bacterium]|nr:DNA primase [Gammaproteobacteria bacterium]